LSITRGLVTIIACGVGFALAGGLLGFTLGAYAPAYYRAVFFGGDEPGFNPVQAGLGLGTSQGAICGVVVGCVAVLAAALSRPPQSKGVVDDFTAHRAGLDVFRSSLARRVFLVLAFLATIGCGGVVGFVYGAVVVTFQHYHENAERDLARVRPILQQQEFARVAASPSSDGKVYLGGSVRSEQARKTLEDRVRLIFGDEEAKSMMGGVTASEK
jgi:hypothetical protein